MMSSARGIDIALVAASRTLSNVSKRLLKLILDFDIYRPFRTARRAGSSGNLFAFITPCG
jgi:hypothetical protein